MILDHGRIAEQGDRAVLAVDPDSRFSQLLRTGMEEVLV
jgi:ATP-binding cassette subfamily B protein